MDYPMPDGRISGERVVYEDLPPGGESLPRGDRIRWDSDVDMRIDDDRDNLTRAQNLRRSHPIEIKFKIRAIPEHMHRGWKS